MVKAHARKGYTRFIIAPDNVGFYFLTIFVDIFLIFPEKHVVGTQKKNLSEGLLLSTHNIHFHGKIRNILILLLYESIFVH